MVAFSRLEYARLVLRVTGTTYRSLRLPQREVFPQRGTVPHREGKLRRSRDSVATVSRHQALGVKGWSGPDRYIDDGKGISLDCGGGVRAVMILRGFLMNV